MLQSGPNGLTVNSNGRFNSDMIEPLIQQIEEIDQQTRAVYPKHVCDSMIKIHISQMLAIDKANRILEHLGHQ